MASPFVISKNRPLPPSRNQNTKWPLDIMTAGDSFEVQGKSEWQNLNNAIQNFYHSSRYQGQRFTVRTVGNETWCCWRIK